VANRDRAEPAAPREPVEAARAVDREPEETGEA
jgi:hypothetical protein